MDDFSFEEEDFSTKITTGTVRRILLLSLIHILAGGNGSGADSLPLVAQPGIDDGLGHLGAAGVAGAEEQNFLHHVVKYKELRFVIQKT